MAAARLALPLPSDGKACQKRHHCCSVATSCRLELSQILTEQKSIPQTSADKKDDMMIRRFWKNWKGVKRFLQAHDKRRIEKHCQVETCLQLRFEELRQYPFFSFRKWQACIDKSAATPTVRLSKIQMFGRPRNNPSTVNRRIAQDVARHMTVKKNTKGKMLTVETSFCDV